MKSTCLTTFYGKIKDAGILSTRAYSLIEAIEVLHRRNDEINRKRVALHGLQERSLTMVSDNINDLFNYDRINLFDKGLYRDEMGRIKPYRVDITPEEKYLIKYANYGNK